MDHPANKEYLSGTIERITYHNPENGFCVIRVKVKKHKDLVTVTGNVPSISVGEYIKCSGIWHNDRYHGKQFKADFLKALPPDTLEGIEKYLGSGLIKGIGPHFAKKLVSTFQENVFDVIEHQPALLSTVDGIGRIRAEAICSNWQEQKIVREIMIFLQSHGVGTTRATKIFKTYGDQAIEIVSQNPYQLAKDIKGIGFISADTIASNLGIAKNSLIRAKAGIAHVLLEATSEGHCGLPKEILIQASQKLLDIEQSIIQLAIDEEIKLKTLVADFLGDIEVIFLASYYFYEKNSAKILLNVAKSPALLDKIDYKLEIALVEQELKIKLAENQQIAIAKAMENRIMVITGGPGTGKTTLVRSLLKILSIQKLKLSYALLQVELLKDLVKLAGWKLLLYIDC